MAGTLSGMKVEIIDLQPWVKKLTVEIPVEKVAGESEAKFKEIGKFAKIAGFRPGKAPRHILEKLYQDSVLGEVGQQLINDGYRSAVEDHKLEVYGEPEFNEIRVEKGKPISFSVVVETFPQITVPDFSGWEFDRVTTSVDEKQLEDQINHFLNDHAEVIPAEGRPAKEGDYVFLDVEGKIDGVEDPALGTKGDKLILSTDGKNMFKEFHQKIVGMNTGEEKEFSMKLPKQYPNAEKAGKTANFKVKVNSIKEIKRPELTDEFVNAQFGFKTAVEMREKLRESAVHKETEFAEQKLRQSMMKKFRESVTFDLPPKLASHYAENYKNRRLRAAGQMGMDLRKSPGFDAAEFEKLCKDKGADMARDEVILETIGKAEKLSPDEAKMHGLQHEYADILGSKSQSDQRNAYMYIIKEAMEESVFKFICGKVKITDKTVELNDVKEND